MTHVEHMPNESNINKYLFQNTYYDTPVKQVFGVEHSIVHSGINQQQITVKDIIFSFC